MRTSKRTKIVHGNTDRFGTGSLRILELLGSAILVDTQSLFQSALLGFFVFGVILLVRTHQKVLFVEFLGCTVGVDEPTQRYDITCVDIGSLLVWRSLAGKVDGFSNTHI